MANTYTKLYTHAVFAVKNHYTIQFSGLSKKRIERYICGIASNIKCNPIEIYLNTDHLHFLFSHPPTVSISDTVRDMKSFSSRFINKNGLVNIHFEWQLGFGAFSYGSSEIESLCKHIKFQENYHMTSSFEIEYLQLLEKYEIKFNKEYLFEF